MKAALVCDVLVLLVASTWCQVPDRPNNFGETYRVYGDTKECSVRADGTRRCRWYQTQYFQDLTTRRLRIDTNVENVYESFYYLPNNDFYDKYIYVPSNWKQPCTRSLVSNIPIQRVPSSFVFNGTDTVEWRPCSVWWRETGNNPVTTERWCVYDNNYVTPPTTEPLRFASERSVNGTVTLTRETLWRGYTTSVDESYFKLPAECPPPAPPQPQAPSSPTPALNQPQTPLPPTPALNQPQTPSSPTPTPALNQPQTPSPPTPALNQPQTPSSPTPTPALNQSQTPSSPTPAPAQPQASFSPTPALPQTSTSQINNGGVLTNVDDPIFNNA